MPVYNLVINEKKYTANVDESTPLLWVLRDSLDLTGTKYGCGKGLCGACTVIINDAAQRSCQLRIQDAEGLKIRTIEGLSESGSHPVQKAWIAENVPQCGYCQSGQIMSAVALLEQNKNPDDNDINYAMQGNLCRCGTYPRIKKAIKRASPVLQIKLGDGL